MSDLAAALVEAAAQAMGRPKDLPVSVMDEVFDRDTSKSVAAVLGTLTADLVARAHKYELAGLVASARALNDLAAHYRALADEVVTHPCPSSGGTT